MSYLPVESGYGGKIPHGTQDIGIVAVEGTETWKRKEDKVGSDPVPIGSIFAKFKFFPNSFMNPQLISTFTSRTAWESSVLHFWYKSSCGLE